MAVYSLAGVFRDVVFYVRTFLGTPSKFDHLLLCLPYFRLDLFCLNLVNLQSELGRYMNSNLRHELPRQHNDIAPFVSIFLLWPGKNSLFWLGR